MRNCDHLNNYFRTISKDLRDAILFFAKREDADLTTERGRDLIVERARRLRDLPTDCRVICYKLIAQGYASDEALDYSFDARNLHEDSFAFYEQQIDAGTPPGEAYDLAENIDRVEMCEFNADAGTRRFIRSLIESGYCPQREEDADKIIDYARQYEDLNDDETREAYNRARACGYDVERALATAKKLNYVLIDAYTVYNLLTSNGADPDEAADKANTFDDWSEDAQEFFLDHVETCADGETPQSLYDLAERFEALDENTRDVAKWLLDNERPTVRDAIEEAEAIADYGMCFIANSDAPLAVGYGVNEELDAGTLYWKDKEDLQIYFNADQYASDNNLDVNAVDALAIEDRETLEKYFDFEQYGRDFLEEHRTFTNRYGELWYIYD